MILSNYLHLKVYFMIFFAIIYCLGSKTDQLLHKTVHHFVTINIRFATFHNN